MGLVIILKMNIKNVSYPAVTRTSLTAGWKSIKKTPCLLALNYFYDCFIWRIYISASVRFRIISFGRFSGLIFSFLIYISIYLYIYKCKLSSESTTMSLLGAVRAFKIMDVEVKSELFYTN